MTQNELKKILKALIDEWADNLIVYNSRLTSVSMSEHNTLRSLQRVYESKSKTQGCLESLVQKIAADRLNQEKERKKTKE